MDCRFDDEHHILRLLGTLARSGSEFTPNLKVTLHRSGPSAGFTPIASLGFNTKERETVTTAVTTEKTVFCAPPEQQFGAITGSNDVLC